MHDALCLLADLLCWLLRSRWQQRPVDEADSLDG